MKNRIVYGFVAFHILKNPRTRRRQLFAQQSVETVFKIIRRNHARAVFAKIDVFVKIHIVAQGKIVVQSIVGNCPFFGNIGLHLQRIVQLYQTVKKLIARPDNRHISSKCWI